MLKRAVRLSYLSQISSSKLDIAHRWQQQTAAIQLINIYITFIVSLFYLVLNYFLYFQAY